MMDNNSDPKQKRKRWDPKDKVKILMRYLKNGESPADLSDEYGLAPNQIFQWAKHLFENAHIVFEPASDRAFEKEIARKDAKITNLNEVVTELSTEVLQLKKENGGRSKDVGPSPKSRAKS